MLFADGAVFFIFLALWVGCFIDVLLTPDGAQRNLPKLAWVFIVLLVPDLGSIAWLVAGHPWQNSGARPRSTGAASRFPEYDRPGRYVPSNPDDDEEFLAGLRKRAEDQRRRAREQSTGETPDSDKPEA